MFAVGLREGARGHLHRPRVCLTAAECAADNLSRPPSGRTAGVFSTPDPPPGAVEGGHPCPGSFCSPGKPRPSWCRFTPSCVMTLMPCSSVLASWSVLWKTTVFTFGTGGLPLTALFLVVRYSQGRHTVTRFHPKMRVRT